MSLKKVLLVDPDSRTRNWVAIRLESMDLHVAEALNAEEAMNILDSQEIHLVVTDGPLEGGLKVEAFFHKLNQFKIPFFLFSQSPRGEESTRFIPRQNRDQLVEQVAVFFGSNHKARHILIIEDSPTLRGFLRRALEKGFPGDVIREAEEGRQAFSLMAQKKVDLIITDMEMPGMDGRTFLNHLNANPILSKKPILVFSSNITSELEQLAANLSNVRLLAKPADPEKVIAEASVLLGDRTTA